MGIIQELENMKYRFVLDLIKNDEAYDKKRVVINGLDIFKLCYNRYLLMQKILLPLKKKIGERVEVTDISFVSGMQDDISLFIKYTKGDKSYVMTISNLDYEDISIVSSDLMLQEEQFINLNKKIILNTFKNISNNYLDISNILKSTSGKFIIKDSYDSFIVKDSEEKVFSMEGKYSLYGKNGSLFDPSKITCNYPKLKELLVDCWNGVAIYQHLHFYKDDLPKQLTKKVNKSLTYH